MLGLGLPTLAAIVIVVLFLYSAVKILNEDVPWIMVDHEVQVVGVRKNLKGLTVNPNGFYLMIEGGAVDWANHTNQRGRMIEEQIDYHQAIAAVAAEQGWGIGEDDLDRIPEIEARVAAEFNNAGDNVEVIGMCVQLEAEAAKYKAPKVKKIKVKPAHGRH